MENSRTAPASLVVMAGLLTATVDMPPAQVPRALPMAASLFTAPAGASASATTTARTTAGVLLRWIRMGRLAIVVLVMTERRLIPSRFFLLSREAGSHSTGDFSSLSSLEKRNTKSKNIQEVDQVRLKGAQGLLRLFPVVSHQHCYFSAFSLQHFQRPAFSTHTTHTSSGRRQALLRTSETPKNIQEVDQVQRRTSEKYCFSFQSSVISIVFLRQLERSAFGTQHPIP